MNNLEKNNSKRKKERSNKEKTKNRTESIRNEKKKEKSTEEPIEKMRIELGKHLLTLFITIIIFTSGIIIGTYLNQNKISDLQSMQRDLTTKTMDNEIGYLLLEEDPCAYVNTKPILSELYELSTKLDYMESLLGVNNSDVIQLKSYYSLLQIKYWLFMKKLINNCNYDVEPILYFYSNKGDCDLCEEEGFILTYIRKNNKNVQVYPFDANLNLNSIQALKIRYGVNETPFLVINDKPYAGFMSVDEILQALNETSRKNLTTTNSTNSTSFTNSANFTNLTNSANPVNQSQ